MKKIIYGLILIFLFIFLSLLTILSTIGIETERFNNFISNKISENTNNIKLDLKTVKFKIDIKDINMFLETSDPLIDYQNVKIPAQKIKVYLNFISILKSDPKIKKIQLLINEINIKQLKKISVNLKPSNFTSFLNNKVNKGMLNTKLDIYFDNNNLIENFIAKGEVLNLEANIIKNITLNDTNFKFFLDKSDILIQNFSGKSGPLSFLDGDLKLKINKNINVESNFNSKLKLDRKSIDYLKPIVDSKYLKNLINLDAEFRNNFEIDFDNTYKVKRYNYNLSGNILKSSFKFQNPIANKLSGEKIKSLIFLNSEIVSNFSNERKKTSIKGNYVINGNNSLNFNLENILKKKLFKIKVDFEYDELLDLELINYKKDNNETAGVLIDIEKNGEITNFNKIIIEEGKNLINFENLVFKKNNFLSLKNLSVKTYLNDKVNNNFNLSYGKKIRVKGKKFDASNLPKILNSKTDSKMLQNVNKEIEIDFDNITAPLSEKLKDFKLIGKIKNGEFVKISSKGNFGQNNFLDISMKNDEKNNKKYLEIYSDNTKPLLTEYNFFKGLTGGKLLYSSIIEGDNSNSKLKIEDFKVINAPGMVKLLSLADLGGLADLAEGEGISFDELEIKMEKTKNKLILTEILALGPSISVLMEGYQDQSVTSLKGTLVPAKTLNKLISKIPLIGDIVIPKEVGEGLFGISFKMKGPPGKIKTSINPIRTITPRFIQKMIDRNKNSN